MPMVPRMLPAAGYARLVGTRWAKPGDFDAVWTGRNMQPEAAGIYGARKPGSNAPKSEFTDVTPKVEAPEGWILDKAQEKQLTKEAEQAEMGRDYVIPGWLLRPDQSGEEPLRRAEDEERLRSLLPAANAKRGQ
jgi:hypothetical protein